MLLLTFLLISNIYAAPTKTVGDYSITIEKNVLTNIVPNQSINRDLNKNLALSSQNIVSIGEQAFYNVPDIETLDLFDNSISTLPPGIFSGLRKLKYLSLANNPLKNIRRAFEGLEHLESLNISNTRVTQLGPSDFFGIPKSTDINTSGDELQTISRALFTKPYPSESTQAILCQHEGIVSSLRRWMNSKSLPTGCTRVEIDPMTPHWVRLNQSGISGFERDWYRLYGTEVDGLDLRGNNIVDITSELFKSLPHRLKYIDLSKNKIERVSKELILLRYLTRLYLSDNLINEIEDGAFSSTNLEWLMLDGNRLNDLRFVATLPRNLLHLNLQNNQLSELQLAESFSSLNKLTKLNLAQNQITKLTKQHLLGLKSLLNLNLGGNGLKHMSADCFERVPKLIHLNLTNNDLTSLEYDVFHHATNIKDLDLCHNQLSTLPRFGFSHLKSLEHLYLCDNALTDFHRAFVGLSSLQYLDVSHNPIASVKTEDFKGVPKTVEVLSKDNTISSATIEAQLTGARLPDESEGGAPILLCMKNGTVTAVRQMTENDFPMPTNCRKIELEESWSPSAGVTTLNLRARQITGFAKNWYDLRAPVTTILLDDNNIVDVTSEMLNDLPKNVHYIHMGGNKIERLKNGVIVNEHLTVLYLDRNKISEIEEDALVKTKLLILDLTWNQLDGVQFVASMPRSLIQLNIIGNQLGALPAGTFSRLDQLKYIYLDNCNINNIGPESFRGLSRLKLLSLESNELTTIDKLAFQDAKALEKLMLKANRLQSLDKQIFHGLINLSHIDLQYNQFQNIKKDSLPYFPDSLQSLDLQYNRMRHVEAGSFIGGLKYELLLQNNNLKTIDEDVFNLPNITVLHLSNNLLSQLNGASFKGMPNLEELYLNQNRLTKIDDGAAKYLNNLYILDISNNPITKLEDGTFSGLSNQPEQKFEAVIRVAATSIEHIHGNLFGDESEVSN